MAEQPPRPPHQVIDSLPVWGVPDAGAVEQMQRCRERADYAALMADHHLGYAVPVGGVIAYADHVSPSGVGFDVSCGNKAVLLDADAGELRRHIGPIMDDLWRTLSFGIGRKNPEPVEHELFDDDPALGASRRRRSTATWRAPNSAPSAPATTTSTCSRTRPTASGSECTSAPAAWATGWPPTSSVPAAGATASTSIRCCSPPTATLGQRYLACMQLAGRYAYAGRDWVCARVARLLGATILDEVHNHHNFAWRERHFGCDLWVVRKGATPAFPGQRGFIGGSMGDLSVIVEGVDSEESRLTLRSTVHGAGRVMSRRRAAGKRRRRRGRVEQVSEGEVSREMMFEWLQRAGVELRGAGTDESPHCYKRIEEVLGFHSGSIRILHTLRPLGVAMAGPDEFDPFRD